MASPSALPRSMVAIVLVVLPVACHSMALQHGSMPTYLVTQMPLSVALIDELPMRLCVAINPSDERGVWWWEAGASGCASRSTGPDLFRGDRAVVERARGGSTKATFRLGTHSSTHPFIDIRLLVEHGQMHSLETGAHVAVQAKSNLEIPFMVQRGGGLVS